MKNLLIILLISLSSYAQQTYPTLGKIITYDPPFSKLVSANAKIEVIATWLKWAEGPVWVKDGGYLLFSDAPQNTIFRWDEKNGLQPFLKPSGYTGLGQYSDEPGSNGLLVNPEGELVACEHGDRRISKMNLSGGGKVTIADNWQGKRFNSPNDICRHSSGTYYFTDPIYGLPGRENDTTNREINEEGVYSVDTKGSVVQFQSKLKRPNGVALSPDETILYVSHTDGANPYIMAYAVDKHGVVGAGKIFFDFREHKEVSNGAADGIKVDAAGNIYAAAANGIVVISPKGKLLGKIETGIPTANCNFGADGYLYITAHHYLCRVKLK